ncbi:MAG: hypothetical protein EOO11_14150 [Chitinophagaceae bacterium]|nr:MAG: hypothetical protein EOO11_14150 [Chitinophagaceae bacterium]
MSRFLSSKLLSRTLLVLTLVLLGLNFLPLEVNIYRVRAVPGEKFDTTLSKELRSIDELLARTDAEARKANAAPGSLEYALVLNGILENRFHQGYSTYRLSQNWVAALSGWIKRDYAAVVIPDDLMKFPEASCSQQSLVAMEALRRKGYDVRKVIFTSHFASEVRVGDRWYFLDANMEPPMTAANAADITTIAAPDYCHNLYHGVFTLHAFHKNFRRKIEVGPVNERIAANVTRFHQAGFWLSKTAFLLPLALLTALYFYRRSRTTARPGSGSLTT